MKTQETENAHLMDWAWKGETLWMRTNHPTNHFIDAAGTDNNMNVPSFCLTFPRAIFQSLVELLRRLTTNMMRPGSFYAAEHIGPPSFSPNEHRLAKSWPFQSLRKTTPMTVMARIYAPLPNFG